MTTRIISACVAMTAVLALSGCSEQPAPADDAAAPATYAAPAAMPRTISPDGASVFFVSPADGATVTSPVSIEFGISGMSLVAAGTPAADSGHHHLLVDTGLPDPGLPIPKDAQHIHFGDASSATELALEPGEHTLQLLLGDDLHIPHAPPVASDVISIIVE
jgi:hypothetical protein